MISPGRAPGGAGGAERAHAERMAVTYATGPTAAIVDAGGNDGFMNLGWAPDPILPGSTAERQRNLVERVVAALDLRPGQRVLDVGCGKGGLVGELHARYPGIGTWGVNIDLAQLCHARPQRAYLQASATRLPFGDDAFDRVVAVEVLGHVADKRGFAEEVARTLRPGGHLVLAVILLVDAFDRLDDARRRQVRRVAVSFNEEPKDTPAWPALRRCLDDAGLAVESFDDLTDGVFTPRHEDLVGLLRALRSTSTSEQAATARRARDEWGVAPEALESFLVRQTQSHACRAYDYHLVTAVRRGDRA